MGKRIDYTDGMHKRYDLSEKMIKEVLSGDFPVYGRQKLMNPYEPGVVHQYLCPDCVCCYISTEDAKDYADPDISYSLNTFGYRSDEFVKNSGGTLFAGCSYTLGYGIPIDNVWSKVVSDYLGDERYNSLGVGGASPTTIFENVYSYIREFGKPERLFVLFPNLERYDNIMLDGDRYKIENIPFQTIFPMYEKFADVQKFFTTEYLLREFVSKVRALEMYAEEAGIELYWGTWNVRLEEVLVKLGGFKNFVSVFTRNNLDDLLYEVLKSGDKKSRYWEVAREGHPGIKEQMIYAKAFIDEYQKVHTKN